MTEWQIRREDDDRNFIMAARIKRRPTVTADEFVTAFADEIAARIHAGPTRKNSVTRHTLLQDSEHSDTYVWLMDVWLFVAEQPRSEVQEYFDDLADKLKDLCTV
jgi:hypothetical protein